MRKRFRLLAAIIVGWLFLAPVVFATGVQLGFTIPILMKAKDPEGVYGYRGIAWYQPQSWVWSRCNVYMAGSVGHWWVQNATYNRSLNIYAIAPVFRWYFKKSPTMSPYFEASIGPSYLTRTHLGDDHNLGMHFAFQDELGLGASFGKEQRFFIGVSALHYSNGRMAAKNAGITIPAILNIGYRFS
jgi:hypothetical protein